MPSILSLFFFKSRFVTVIPCQGPCRGQGGVGRLLGLRAGRLLKVLEIKPHFCTRR